LHDIIAVPGVFWLSSRYRYHVTDGGASLVAYSRDSGDTLFLDLSKCNARVGPVSPVAETTIHISVGSDSELDFAYLVAELGRVGIRPQDAPMA